MITFPNAKINLGLNIISRRSDGYHDIESIMYPVAWTDILEIVPSKGVATTLRITGNAVDCPIEKNLVYRAYELLKQSVDIPSVDIFLHKIIPDGAGLGGGSADAAFTLRLLNDLFALGFSDNRLAEFAAQLGADCPFFIYNRPMLATGTGTRLTPVNLSLGGFTIAIVKPDDYVSTREAYAGVHPQMPAVSLAETLAGTVDDLLGIARNDFERSVFPDHPAIASVAQGLRSLGADYVSMSGSGSSVYALFKRDVNKKILHQQLSEMFAGMKIHLSELSSFPSE